MMVTREHVVGLLEAERDRHGVDTQLYSAFNRTARFLDMTLKAEEAAAVGIPGPWARLMKEARVTIDFLTAQRQTGSE